MGKNNNRGRLIEKQDLIHLAILLAIASGIGTYLIVTTVLIAEDGVFYIGQAQKLLSDPAGTIKAYPPGYPFLIMIAHKFSALFSNSTSIYRWIYSAQSVSLLCRLLALVPLYFIGKLLVGGKKSFPAILILIMLPYPAEFGSDVLREWPHTLPLAWSMLFLIMGSKSGKWWMFAIAGLVAGLGQTIRAECAQIVIYGVLWFLTCLFLPRQNISRFKAFYLTLILLLGFAIPTVPYMKAKGEVLPPKLKGLVLVSRHHLQQSDGTERNSPNHRPETYTASGIPTDILKALGELARELSDNLMHFFVLPLAIGLYSHFRKLRKVLLTDRFFIFALIALYLVMMILLQINSGYISRRHCMSIVVFTAFYIPPGLQLFARWLNKRLSKNKPATLKDRKRLVLILMTVGIGICIAKFIRITPLRWEKRYYLDAAKWLNENTRPDDVIAFSHLVPRIGFYAERTTTILQKGTSTISAGKISPEKWCHLAGTFDGKHQKLYINGKLAASAEPGFDAINTGHDNLAIGKPYAGADSYFKGSIKEVRLYNRALSDKEIEALYNHQITETESRGLVGYWPLEGNTSDVNERPEEGMIFDGLKDYVDLSGLGPALNVNELTVSAKAKPESLDKTIWILGNGAQFRIGIRKSSARFWIQEGPPGKKIPANATYVVVFVKKEENELQVGFNRKVQEKHSVWADRKGKKTKIVIYKIL